MRFRSQIRARRIKSYHENASRVRKHFYRRSVIIHHYCPHTFNAGDHFVIASIRKHIRINLPQAVFVPRSIAVNRGWGAPHHLRGENVALANRAADAVIVGGSDNYRNWSPRIDGNEIDKLQPPLFLLGLGVSSNDLGEPPLIQRSVFMDDIRKVNERASVSTVRDEATLTFLRNLGIENAELTGCPALYIRESQTILSRPDGPLIMTFPFPVNRRKLSGRYQILHAVIEDLLRKYPEAILSCHDDRDVEPASERFPEARLFYSNDWHDYLSLYGNASLVVGSRLHGSLLAAGLSTPFLNINVDIRGESFTKTFNLDQWNLDYNNKQLIDSIHERILRIRSGDLGMFDRFVAKKTELKPVFDRSMEKTALCIRERLGLKNAPLE